jgi:hypothetical protein
MAFFGRAAEDHLPGGSSIPWTVGGTAHYGLCRTIGFCNRTQLAAGFLAIDLHFAGSTLEKFNSPLTSLTISCSFDLIHHFGGSHARRILQAFLDRTFDRLCGCQ